MLARNLRMLRFLRGWSQEQLAEESGLHRTYISLIEREECNISVDNLERLADAFGLSLPDLLSLSEAALTRETPLPMPDPNEKHPEEVKRMLILTRTTGEMIHIRPDPKIDPATPIREIFAEGPIEVLVASLRGSRVRLGISLPLSLVVNRK